MNNIKIQTLTPVHIGDGSELQGKFEYLHFTNEHKIAVIDAEKVLDILGEENIGHWVACIEKGEPLLPVLQKRKANLKADDVALRTIPLSIATKEKPIRSQIYSGNGQALLPGSSIKGSIRTAIWAELVFDNGHLAKDKRNLGNTDARGGFRWSDSPLSKALFGSDPNHDIFRLLQVGDAAFDKTEVFRTDVINMYGKSWRIKEEITQYVEAIPAGVSTYFNIRFNDLLKSRATTTFNKNVSKLEIKNLVGLINDHTKRLIQDEISYWLDKEGNPDALGDYVDEMQRIESIIEDCSTSECVLRLGWGSGFRSMTGDWHGTMTDDDYYRLVKSIRPRHPEDLVFPKTTRFVTGGMPLGFVKLSF